MKQQQALLCEAELALCRHKIVFLLFTTSDEGLLFIVFSLNQFSLSVTMSVCLSVPPPSGPKTVWTGDFWSKSVFLKGLLPQCSGKRLILKLAPVEDTMSVLGTV